MAKQKVEKKKILIVEDELFTLELYERQLKKAGYDVYQAADGEEGFEAAKKVKPDLILLDVMLPKVDGFEMLRNLKDDKETEKIPVLVLTKLGYESVLKQSKALGVSGFLFKSDIGPERITQSVSKFFTKTPTAH